MAFPGNKLLVAICTALILTACSGDDGMDGAKGSAGVQGAEGSASLIEQTTLHAGHSNCFKGGLQIDSGIDTDGNGELAPSEVNQTSYVCMPSVVNRAMNFIRLATFNSCKQYDASCNNDTETVAEISAASEDGNTIIYTDSPNNQVGFVDISNAGMPKAAGFVTLDGEPTSVAVAGNYALVGVNTSTDYVNVDGVLDIVDITTQKSVHKIDLNGQPDSVAVSPDKSYAAVVIENERDELYCVGGTSDGQTWDDEDLAQEQCEDVGGGVLGGLPQTPAGELIIVNLAGEPTAWTSRNVNLTGLAELYPADPEPEFVDINSNNIAVVTMQENNHLVLVDLTDGSIVKHFSAGVVDLEKVDASEENNPIVFQTESLTGVPREPDGVSWINNAYFATADEGDFNGGSRGFTIFNTQGEVIWSSGATLDHMAAKFGHYNEGRSKNKGNEPENVEMGIFGEDRYLFVNSERSSLIFVYDVADPRNPVFKQVLPAALGPEGALAIPSRNLLVVSSEKDKRKNKFRGGLNIYRYDASISEYPTIASANRDNGTPIPYAALSGLAADIWDTNIVYSIEDSAFASSRIFKINVAQSPAVLTEEIRISDANDIFAKVATVELADDAVGSDDDSRKNVFDEADLTALINGDKTVNIDPEGISVASDGGFWIASEGSGTVGDDKRPVNSLNFVFKTDAQGVIENVFTLPSELNDVQLRFGFEGIAEYEAKVYVAFQRAWNSENTVRIGELNPADGQWSFYNYTLDSAESQNGGWVGLSDLTALGDGKFLVLERDNQAGPDAAIKRLYEINLTGLNNGDSVTKTLVRNLIPDLAAKGGPIPEKVEGLAVLANGDVLIVNDNDGVDDNSGETQLINLDRIFHPLGEF